MEAWNSELRHGFRLAEWVVRPDQCTIEGESGTQHVEPKVMEVLLYLALLRGEVARRDRLIQEVWRTVVGDEVLSRAISVLRSHLGDDPKAPRFILTIPKAGYRLIPEAVPLPRAVPAGVPDAPAATPAPGPEPLPANEARPPHRVRTGRIVLGAVVAIAVLALWLGREQPASERIPGGYADLREWFEAILDGDHATIASVAVLPFQDVSEQGGYLGDSITDELILSLSQVQGLKVVARRSILALPDEMRDIRAIGRYFAVDAILEGTVKRYGSRLRVSAQLGSTRDGFVLWSHTFDRPVDEVFALQGDVVEAVTRHLQQIATGELQAPEPATVAAPSLEAYQLFLNGRYLVKLRGTAPRRNGIRLFEEALAADPGFTRARLALAAATALLPYYDNQVDEQETLDSALAMLDALELTEARDLAEAESIRGLVADRRWQWVEAEQHHTRALELNPYDPSAYSLYSQHLSMVGRLGDSLKAAQRGKELDDVAAVVLNRLAVAQLWVDDNVGAAENFAIGSEHGFSSDANLGYLILLHRVQRWPEMRHLFTLVLEHNGYDPGWVGPLFEQFGSGDKLAAAIAACEQAIADGDFPPRAELPTWILLGDLDRAYRTLDAYASARRNLDIEFLWSREAAALRADQRFEGLVEQLGLAAYWKRFGPPDQRG